MNYCATQGTDLPTAASTYEDAYLILGPSGRDLSPALPCIHHRFNLGPSACKQHTLPLSFTLSQTSFFNTGLHEWVIN